MDQSDIIGPSEVLLPGSDLFVLRFSLLLGVVAAMGLVVAVSVRLLRRRRGLERKRPTATRVAAGLLVLALVVGLLNRPPPFFVPEFPALPQLFDDEAFFYRPVTDLAAIDRSDAVIQSLGGAGILAAAGMPFNLVDEDTERRQVAFTYQASSDDVGYPMAEPPYIQSMPFYGVDEHYIAIDVGTSRMWELWAVRNWFGRWRAGSGTLWDLSSLNFAEGGTTASQLPIMPLIFTYAEVASGSVNHAISAAGPVVGADHIWPARGSDGPSDDPRAPPMGTWFRLRSDADLSQLGPQARVIAEAMQVYGVVLTDTGGTFAVGGTIDARWNEDDLATLAMLSTDDLEVLDTSALMIEKDSMAVVPPG